MYKINKATKIGRAIEEIINNGLFREAFEQADISFLTSPDEEHSDMNVHIYPEDRVEHLKIYNNNFNGWFKEKNIHIPGCITNSLIEKYSEMALKAGESFPEIEKHTTITVEFGNNAASSRTQETQNEIIEYPVNSHNQLDELRFLFDSNITLIHSYNPKKEKTTIKIKDFIFEIDTVISTAKTAVDTAITLIYKTRKKHEIK